MSSTPVTARRLLGLSLPSLGVLAAAALFYNISFFVLLAYSPFPLELDAMQLGLTFFGWGIGLAVTSVFVAPLLTARMPRTRVLKIALIALALVHIGAALLIDSTPGLICMVILGGLVLGVMNTVLTECVMEATDLPRSVASSAYSGVRFLGGAVAPIAATEVAALIAPEAAYYAAAASSVIALLIVVFGGKALSRVNGVIESPVEEAQAISVGDA